MATGRSNRAVISLLLVLGMTALVATMVVEATTFTRSPRLLPLIVGIPTLALLLIQVVRDVRRMVSGDRTGGTASEQEADRYSGNDPADGADDSAALANASPVVGTLWVLLLVLIVWLLGFLVAIPIFIVLFMRYFGRETWRLSILFAIGTFVVTYLFFVVVIEVQLIPGRLAEFLPFL